jgi:sn-glycerol 3-phosphate transport system substrate-binding protein
MTVPSRHRSVVAVLCAAGLLAACSSGQSILTIGQDPPPTSPTTVPSAGGGTVDPGTSEPGATVAPTIAPTTTQAPLAEFGSCPVDALDEADGPVEITFWHGLGNDLENALITLTDAYNASQDRVVVDLQNQTSYDSAIDKYIQSSQDGRPDLIQFPEYTLQSFAQSGTLIPVEACIEASGYDTSPFLSRALDAYTFEGIRWSMPFNVSNPVLYFNRKAFEAAGLDPDAPPLTLEELRAASQAIVDSGAATYGWVVDSGPNSGGGWFLEQWFGRAGQLYADNGNGRVAPATQVLYADETGVELLTFVQQMIQDGLAVSVGDNSGGVDAFLKVADPAEPGAMTIGTSAAMGLVFSALGGGLIPGFTPDDVGVGPMPGPSAEPGAQVGGGALWIVDQGDEQTAASWDFIQFLVSAESQSTWAAATGYVPVRADAVELEPLRSTYADDPRFRVPYDQLLTTGEGEASLSPVLGPQREVRVATANAVAAILGGADVATSLADAATQSNALIASYNQRN